MKLYQPDFIHPQILNNDRISSWFTRKGESVQDVCKIEGFNFGFNTYEDEGVIKENRNYLADSISTAISRIAFANQVHGTEILEVSGGGIYKNVDGFITKEKGLALAIQVADCAALLLGDSKSGVIAAVHAGWRGAIDGIVPKAVNKLLLMGSKQKDIQVFLSPCISQNKFEVGEEVAVQFPEEFVDRSTFKKPHVDLSGYIVDQLLKLDIDKDHIENSGSCTYSDSNLYSYRRDGKQAGRMLGIIKLNDTV